jgi:hypothetical protein
MTWSKDPLWRALAEMWITPDGSALSFAAKLAGEEDWSVTHAEAVVEEYRRFLYLAATGAGAVTPSEDVDQAWHLHLGYSRHYWDVLCGTILKRPFHHDPGAGGADEDARHRAQYRDTLQRYRAVFGVVPPPAIWPVSPPAARPVRIDRARYWLLPKALTKRAGGVAAASLLVAACTALAGNHATSDEISMAIPVIAIGVILIALAVASTRKSGNRRGGDGGGSSCGSDGDSGSDGGSSCGGGGCGGD